MDCYGLWLISRVLKKLISSVFPRVLWHFERSRVLGRNALPSPLLFRAVLPQVRLDTPVFTHSQVCLWAEALGLQLAFPEATSKSTDFRNPPSLPAVASILIFVKPRGTLASWGHPPPVPYDPAAEQFFIWQSALPDSLPVTCTSISFAHFPVGLLAYLSCRSSLSIKQTSSA